MKGAVNYNENKVKEGTAILLMVSGYHKNTTDLKFYEKYNRLQKLADLNTRTSTNCIHASLNFDVSEKMSPETLQQIAKIYMEKLGFGQQPFLVYQHFDAGHDHIHIVSTNIRKDGKRISLHKIGSVQSEKARKEIEILFDLVKAGDKQRKELQILKPVNLEKVEYGKTATHRAIKNIVTKVVSQYKFESLHELNAILQLYNVMADRGHETSRMYEKNGLQYTLLNVKGERVGIPIKASSIDGKPTLANLEKKYEINKQQKELCRNDTRKSVDQALVKQQSMGTNIILCLRNKGIDLVLRKNANGFIYGVTYVDHNTNCVFNGSELGKQYSAAVLREKLNPDLLGKVVTKTESRPDKHNGQMIKESETNESKGKKVPFIKSPLLIEDKESNTVSITSNLFEALKIVTDVTHESNYLPWQLKKKRRRRKPGQKL